MSGANTGAGRQSDVWRALARVADPELDEPITEMGFVEHVGIDGSGAVAVDFRLPTYWCSPNFAFLMADGVHREVSVLPWCTGVRVRLLDHCFGDRINAAVGDRGGFDRAFAELSDGEDLGALRETFLKKAFQRRQEVMLLALQRRGLSGEAIAAMSLGAYDRLHFATGEEAAQAPRYRALLTESGLAMAPDDLVFRTWEGERLDPLRLRGYLQALRGVRLNMEFNGALCRGLKQARYKEADPPPDGEPELIDFILNRVPPRDEAAGKTVT